MISSDIYKYIKTEEANFDANEIRVGDNWNWNFKDHVQMIFHLKNSKFFQGENNWLRAFNNIMEPVLNLSYWTEDIEVKDIVFFIEQERGRILSFLIKKYHDEVYVKENNIDTLIDEITEEDLDYGGVLVQKGEKHPEVIYMPSIAFCDQTDIMGGVFGVKYNFTPDKLRQMSAKGWGNEANGATISIDELILQAEATKSPSGRAMHQDNKTTTKNIEIYIVRGSLPEHYLKDNDNMEDYYNQLHIVAFYKGKKGEEGVTLFRMEEKEPAVKFHTCKKIYGRALGRGVGESLLHPQIWTNFLEIHKTNMLEAGSKNVLYTDDDNYTDRQKITDMDNNEITTIEDNKRIFRVPTDNPMGVQLFEKSINSWFEIAQTAGSAFDPILGKEPPSGTTFRGQERTVAQGRGIHDRRRGQRAKFIEELYRWDIIPRIKKEIMKGVKFLATLTSEELKWASDVLIENKVNDYRNEEILSGKIPTPKEVLEPQIREEVKKKGNKWLLEIMKDEFKGVEIKMGINIAGKQKNLAVLSDKILSIFQFVFSNPQGFQQTMQLEGMASAFNDILEFSGINPVDFSGLMQMPAQPEQPIRQLEVPQTLTPQNA
jgi:hypothetical protein